MGAGQAGRGAWLCVLLILLAAATSEAVADTKYYDVLGVSPDADDRTIKKAYKKQALKWHPDRNQDKKEKAEKRFQEIAHAYEILSDPEKKKMYDQFGEEALKQGGGPGGGPGGGFQFRGDPFEMFNSFFGGGGGGFPGGGGKFTFNMGGGGGPGGGFHMGGGGFPGGMGGGFPGGMGGGFPGGQRGPRHGGGGSGGLYDGEANIEKLTSANFPTSPQEWVWLVEFYSPGCGHCQSLAPKWKLLAEKLKGVVKVGAVNCAQDNKLCQQHQVQGVPTIKALAPGDKTWTDYHGQRAAGDISEWATALIPNKVASIRTKAQLTEFLSRCSGSGKSRSKQHASWGLCVVLVTDKTSTPSLWKALSSVYADKVAFGFVRSKDSDVAAELGPAPQLPAVFTICNGDLESKEVLKGKLKSEPLQQQLGAYALGKKCSSKIKVDATTDLSKLSVSQLKAVLQGKGVPCTGCFEKSDYIKALKGAIGGVEAKQEL